MLPTSSIWIPSGNGHQPRVIQRVGPRQADMPGYAAAEPATAAPGAGGCGRPERRSPCSGITLRRQRGHCAPRLSKIRLHQPWCKAAHAARGHPSFSAAGLQGIGANVPRRHGSASGGGTLHVRPVPRISKVGTRGRPGWPEGVTLVILESSISAAGAIAAITALNRWTGQPTGIQLTRMTEPRGTRSSVLHAVRSRGAAIDRADSAWSFSRQARWFPLCSWHLREGSEA
jgi:hypothetical protein